MAVSKKFTRSEFNCPLFGNPKELPLSKLPTYEDVLKCFFYEHYNLVLKTNNIRLVSLSEVSNIVAQQVKSVFNKASIPTVSSYRIVQIINAYHDSYRNLMKSFKRDREKEKFKKRVDDFKQKSLLLFDVSACKCKITIDCICHKVPEFCECPPSIICNCEKAKKIPIIELKFLYLQRNFGKGKIGSVDIKETKKITYRNERKLIETERTQIISQPSCSTHKITENFLFEEDDCDSNEEIEDEDEKNKDFPKVKPKIKSPWQMRIKLKNTALTSDRFGLSDRATAAVASSVLQDFGIITDYDHTNVIDKNKLRREKSLNRSKLQMLNKDKHNPLQGLYFDGRRDDTLIIEKIKSKQFRRTKKEDHYSILQEPGSVFVGHVSPSSGSAENIANSILSYLTEAGFSIDELDVIGCDGTVTNTGWKTGVICNFEKHVKRPLQWCVCLLHFNELPFRHLFKYLDGETTGPKSFSGPIGTQLSKCEKLPVVNFDSVKCEIPEIDRTILSKDQQYLLDISSAINLGSCSEDLRVREPGSLSHSRWLTTANRILRLYLSIENPTEQHKILVSFILKSYMPVWFHIKKSKYFTDGPKHVFEVIESSRFLPENLQTVIDPVIERNAFFAHAENLVLSMIVDKRSHIRELGFRRIIKARKCFSKRKLVRSFQPPKINFQATDYIEMIDWNTASLSPPPLLRRLTDQEIWSKIQSGEKADEWNFNKFPCHTQAVERCVKLVTEASQKVVGSDARDGFIRSTLLSRSSMPSFSSKCYFKLPKETKDK